MKLILFDIDGTLLHAHGSGVRATYQSLREFFGVEGPPPGYSMGGKIDTQIVRELVAHAGVDAVEVDTRLEDYWQAYLVALEQELPQRPVLVLPGIADLLAALRERTDVVVGLLTGNVGGAATLKLLAANIDPSQFRLAAYGHEAETRDDLPTLAVGRAEALTGYRFRGKEIVIIGDTPADVSCGASLGVRTIAVATGGYSVESLLETGADVVFANLADTHAALEAILA